MKTILIHNLYSLYANFLSYRISYDINDSISVGEPIFLYDGNDITAWGSISYIDTNFNYFVLHIDHYSFSGE